MKKMRALKREPPNTVAQWSIWFALEDDPDLLVRRVQSGQASDAEIALLKDIVKRKVKPRRLRKGQPSRLTNQNIAEAVFYLECFRPEWQRKKIFFEVAKAFRVSEKHVHNVLVKRRGEPIELPYETVLLKSILAN